MSKFRFLLLVTLVALVVRVVFLVRTGFVIDSDEAIVGLMGLHLTEGRDYPLFYYGQAYMGSFEALLVYIMFSFFGVSNWALKAAPLLFSLLLVPLSYRLGKALDGELCGRLAALFSALGPPALIIWSSKARGGFIELVVLGTWSLLLCIECYRTPSLRKIALLGFVLGLSWWINNQAIYFIIACGLFLLGNLKQWGVALSLKLFVVGFLLFLVGSGPFWYLNLFEEPRWQTFARLSGSVSLSTAAEQLWSFFSLSIPILLGARPFWSNVDYYPSFSQIFTTLYCVVGVSGLRRAGGKKSEAPYLLCFFTMLVMPIIFSLSKFGALSQAPRYLLPLYAVLPVFCAYGTTSFLRLKSSFFRGVGIGSALSILLLNCWSNIIQLESPPGQPFVFLSERVPVDNSELVEWLDINGVSHVHTDYWVGYRLSFETKEQVTFSRFGEPRDLRIPEYEVGRAEDIAERVYVLTIKQASDFQSDLVKMGWTYQRERVGPFVVVRGIRPMHSFSSEAVVPNLYRLRAGYGVQVLANAVDMDPGTRWSSATSQRKGMELFVDFEEPRPISGVRLDFGFWRHDWPSGLEVFVIDENLERCFVFQFSGNSALNELSADARIYFEPVLASGLLFRLASGHPVFDWSLAEIEVLAPEQEE